MRMGFSVDSNPQNLLISSPTNEKPMQRENPNAEFDDSQSGMKSGLPLDFNVSDHNTGTIRNSLYL